MRYCSCALQIRGGAALSESDLALSIALGVGLAAAAGFRVFLPLLVMSAAAVTGHLPLSAGFAWLATPTALAMLSAAALLEVLAYYIPGVDNLLDALAAPAAIVAGVIASAAVMTDLPPVVKWTTAVIAGGGAAGLIHSGSAALRAGSTLATGGLGNPLVATAELTGSLLVSLLALAAPFAALALLVIVGVVALQVLRRFLRRRPAAPNPPVEAADG
jgi:hypothetical protein